MAGKFWIKLYHEILDDPKMGQLPNHLWRRAIELFLLAGKNGNDGVLQPVEEMQWTLRLEPERLLEDLHRLAEVGVVHEAEPGRWVVTHFRDRQDADTSTERVQRFRKRTGNDYETKSSSNETEIEIDKELKIEIDSGDALARAWEDATGTLVGQPGQSVDAINEMLAFGVEAVDIKTAVAEMAAKGKNRWLGISSIVNPAKIALSKRKANGNGAAQPTPPARANYEW